MLTDAEPEILAESGLKNLAAKARTDVTARDMAVVEARTAAAKAAAAAAPPAAPAVKA